MLDARARLRAGAIVAEDAAPADERTAILRARTYEHPSLAGRVVVRLSTDVIAPGADVEMKALGFAPPRVGAPLGRAKFRALGFPGWALANDPDHARFALEVMQDFKKAVARARSKPGHARDALVEIAERLGRTVPHFLPSFWEEAGRAFLAEDSTTFAAQAFEKARQAENVHKLAVDHELRGDVFLEFALAGALAVKTLSAYGKELQKTLGAEAAYPRFAELALRRTLGGLPPWTGMGKELRALAAAAKLDVAVEDACFVTALLEASSITRAPDDLWTTYRAGLVRAAASSVDVRRKLLHLFPSLDGKTMPAWWLDLLTEIGALDLFDGVEGDLEAAEWFGRLLGFAPGEPRLVTWLERLAPRILAEGKPLQVAQGNKWRRRADLAVTERALELGLALADVRVTGQQSAPYTPFDLTAGVTRDAALTATHERFGAFLVRAVAAAMGAPPFEASAAGKPALTKLRRAWLEEKIGALEGSLAQMDTTLEVLTSARTVATFRDEPDLVERLAAVSPSRALRHVLRAGLYAELAWPALEEAFAELGGARVVQMSGAFPFLILHNGVRAIVLGSEGRVLEHDLQMKMARNVTLYFAGGQLFVASRTEAYWSARPAERFVPVTAYMDPGASVQLADGAVTFGGQKVVPGDTKVTRSWGLVGDGTGLWITNHQYETQTVVLKELDPETGSVGRASWPSLVERSLQPNDQVVDVALLPAPAGLGTSPLGMAHGLIGGWRLRRGGVGAPADCVTVSGERIPVPAAAKGKQHALLALPGADERLFLSFENGYNGRTQEVWRDGVLLGVVGYATPYERGGPPGVPYFYWNLFTFRDEAGSRALRAVDDATAAGLFAAGLEDWKVSREEDDAEGTSVATRRALSRLLPAVKAPGLVEAVVANVRLAARLSERLAVVVQDRRLEAVQPVDGPAEIGAIPSAELHAALPRTARTEAWGRARDGGGDVARNLRRASSWLDGGPLPAGTDPVPGASAWSVWIGSMRGLAVLLGTHAIEPEKRAVVVRLLRAWSRSVFARERASLRVVRMTVPEGTATALGIGGKTPLFAVEGSRFVGELDFDEDPADGRDALVAIERTSDGVFRLPPKATLTSEQRFAAGDDEAWLEAFLGELDARGAFPPWEPAPIDEVAQRTGLSRAEATLLWGGLPDRLVWRPNGAGNKTLREAMGLKSVDAEAAVASLRNVNRATQLALFTAAAPEDPRALWSEPAAVAARLVDAWKGHFGERTVLREELVAAVTRDLSLPRGLPAATALRTLIDPVSAPLLKLPEHAPAQRGAAEADVEHFGHASLVTFQRLVPYLFDALPVGDPYRDALAPLIDAIRSRLATKGLLVSLGGRYFWGDELRPQALALLETVSGASPTVAGLPEGTLVRDDGVVRITLEPRGSLSVWGYPAADLERDPRVAGLASADHLDRVLFFTGERAVAFAERIRATPVPAGQYEANPRLSAPATVEAAKAQLGVSEGAATLYLQLLAMPEPSTKNVRRWNGWGAAEAKSAAAELLAKKLVVEGKREGSGREVFLPGAWEPAARVESWKHGLYLHPRIDSREPLAPPRPHHLLFAEAWRRIDAGDVPQLEQVRR